MRASRYIAVLFLVYEHLAMEYGYAGSYNSVRRYVRATYPKPKQRTYRRVETPPGAQTQTDWGEYPMILNPEQDVQDSQPGAGKLLLPSPLPVSPRNPSTIRPHQSRSRQFRPFFGSRGSVTVLGLRMARRAASPR